MPAVFSSIIFEKQLHLLGYKDFNISSSKCITLDINTNFDVAYLVLSGYMQSGSRITVYWNDVLAGYISRDGNFTSRIKLIPDGNFNKLKTCFFVHEAPIFIDKNSKIIAFSYARFLKRDFKKCIPLANNCLTKLKVPENSDINVIISVKNSGSRTAYVKLKTSRFSSKKYAEFGKLSWEFEIRPGETKTVSYRVHITKGDFLIMPAVLYYKNPFGDEEIIFSNPVVVKTLLQTDINALILSKEGKPFLTVFNKSSNDANIHALVFCDSKKLLENYFTLKGNSYREFKLPEESCYNIKCIIYANSKKFTCKVNIQKEYANLEIVSAALILIFISTIVLLYIKFFIK